MAYSFQTFTVGQVLTAAQMNQVEVNIRDHIHGQNGVSAMGLSAAQVKATSVHQYTGSAFIIWDGTDYDNGTFFNTASNTRVTITNSNRYLINAYSKLTITSGSPVLNVQVLKNRTSIIGNLTITNSSYETCRIMGGFSALLSAADYIELLIDNTGGAFSVDVAADYSPKLSIVGF